MSFQQEENFLIQKEGRIAKVAVNRPEHRNSFKDAMWYELIEIVKKLESDPEVMVVVITGAGEESFCAGADISEMTRKFSLSTNKETVRPVVLATRTIENIEKVVIAMINGYAIGGGCELAIACDMRVAADSARLGITQAKIGICISLENIKRLIDLVGPSKAKNILFTGKLLSAQEALSAGLIDYVVPKRELELFTMDLANLIAQNEGNPLRVKIQDFAVPNVKNEFTYTVPAKSVNILEIGQKT